MAYKVNSNLDKFIKDYIEEVSKKEDRVITIKEAMEELGEFAKVSWNTIKMAKDKDTQPSLSVAIRIAEFFKVTVHDIWTVEFVEEQDIGRRKYSKKSEKEKAECSHENCGKKAIARGMCNNHYHNWRNKNLHMFNKEKQTTCSEENCNNPFHAKGLCSYHYNKTFTQKRYAE